MGIHAKVPLCDCGKGSVFAKWSDCVTQFMPGFGPEGSLCFVPLGPLSRLLMAVCCIKTAKKEKSSRTRVSKMSSMVLSDMVLKV